MALIPILDLVIGTVNIQLTHFYSAVLNTVAKTQGLRVYRWKLYYMKVYGFYLWVFIFKELLDAEIYFWRESFFEISENKILSKISSYMVCTVLP